MADYTRFPETGVQENERQSELLRFMERPLQELLAGSARQQRACRDALQRLLPVRGPDALWRMCRNESVQTALCVTGIELVPRPSLLCEDTRRTMRDIVRRRRPHQVFY